MTVTVEEPTLFENEDWVVLESGLEHKRTGYFIAREELASRRSDDLWSWPLHMAEKSWCALPAFMEAFTCAATVYGVPVDPDLARSFNVARCEIASPARTKPANPGPDRDFERLAALQSEGRVPISWEPARAGYFPIRSSLSAMSSQERPRYRDPAQGHTFPSTARARLSLPDASRAKRWRASRRIRLAGTQIVRLLRAAWNIR
jgi:hypothetical protein